MTPERGEDALEVAASRVVAVGVTDGDDPRLRSETYSLSSLTVDEPTLPTSRSRDDEAAAASPEIIAGRYRVDGVLGAGGMGIVYRVRDLSLDEDVALKMLQVRGPDAVAAFKNEVKLARRVTHRNVARVFDFGEHGGGYFLTMEWVDGASLRGLRERGPLALRTALSTGLAIAEGLSAVHQAGVVHRDLKPHNVLVTGRGEVKLTDFGVAISGPREEGAPKTLAGTPAYMAPEVLRGEHATVASDVYALGLVVLELLTGERIARRMHAGEPLESALPKSLPVAVREALLPCLDADPLRRPSSAEEVARTLERLAEAERAGASSAPPDAAALRPALHVGLARLEGTPEAPEEDFLAVAVGGHFASRLGGAHGVLVRAAPLDGPDALANARDAGLHVVVDGAVTRAGGELRIRLRARTVADGVQIWARAFTTSLEALQPELDAAAAALAGRLSARAPADVGTALTEPKAVELYLRARHAESVFDRPVSEAAALYEQALEIEPKSPMLLVGYAMCVTRGAPDPLRIDRAQRAAEEAIRLAPDLADAHAALAQMLFAANDNLGAARSVVQSLALGPSQPNACSLVGALFAEMGDDAPARRFLQLTTALEPRLVVARINLARLLSLLGEHAEADALLSQTAPVGGSTYWMTRARIAMTRDDEHRSAEAQRILTSAFPLYERLLDRRAPMAEIEALLGPVGGVLPHSAARRRAWKLQVQAEVSAFRGDLDAAEQLVVRADESDLFDLLWLARHPLVAVLRGRPDYDRVRAHVEARAEAVRAVLARALPQPIHS